MHGSARRAAAVAGSDIMLLPPKCDELFTGCCNVVWLSPAVRQRVGLGFIGVLLWFTRAVASRELAWLSGQFFWQR